MLVVHSVKSSAKRDELGRIWGPCNCVGGVFFWQHVQHVCTTNLCVYDTFNHQLARLPTFGNLCHFVNCRTPPTPNDNSLNSNDSALQFICIHKNEPNECLEAFLFLVSQTMPSHKYKDTHTQHIHTYSYIQWTHFVHVKQLRHNKNVCLWANFIWSVCITKSFVCVCIVCKDMSIFVCVHVYLYVNVNGIVLVYLTGYVCIFIPLTLFSRFKRIPWLFYRRVATSALLISFQRAVIVNSLSCHFLKIFTLTFFVIKTGWILPQLLIH